MHHLTEDYLRLLDEMRELHLKKQADYGSNSDPFANLRATREFNIAPWLGCCLRANDKMARIKSFLEKGVLVNESLADSLIDAASYFLLALVLYRDDLREQAIVVTTTTPPQSNSALPS